MSFEINSYLLFYVINEINMGKTLAHYLASVEVTPQNLEETLS